MVADRAVVDKVTDKIVVVAEEVADKIVVVVEVGVADRPAVVVEVADIPVVVAGMFAAAVEVENIAGALAVGLAVLAVELLWVIEKQD